jgi:uncharacterized membrane protein YidH (DUF202 family)
VNQAERCDEKPGGEEAPESVEIGRIQLLLAEKRTSLAALRTGIAIFTLPLSVTTVLVTTSRFYNFVENLHYLIPLLVVCVGLVLAGAYLIVVSLVKFQRESRQIARIKERHRDWQDLFD